MDMENQFRSVEELMKYVETEALRRAKRALDENNVPN